MQPAGLRQRDPGGGRHPVRTGERVTFTAANPTMTWQLIAANDKVVGNTDASVATTPRPTATPAIR